MRNAASSSRACSQLPSAAGTRGGVSYERAEMNTDSERAIVYHTRLNSRRFQSAERNQPRRRSFVLRNHHTRTPDCVAIDVTYNYTKMMHKSGHWEFDVFHFDVLTGGRPLLFIGYHIFHHLGLMHEFKLDIVRLMDFISKVEDNYHGNNPYHNVLHAADVTQAMFCFLCEKKLSGSLGGLEKLVAVLSAMLHDVDHPGVTNVFLKLTNSHLAHLYKDSILENHHGRFGLALLHDTGLLSDFQPAKWSKFASLFKAIILATDILHQGEYVQKFKEDIRKLKSTLKSSEETRHFILKIAMKCSDVCNPCRVWPVSQKWSKQVCDEFFRQSAVERHLGLKLTELFDPKVQTVSKIQIGFINGVVLPLFELWHSFMDESHLSTSMLRNVRSNRDRWLEIRAKEEKGQAGKAAADLPHSGSSSSGKSVGTTKKGTITQTSSSPKPSTSASSDCSQGSASSTRSVSKVKRSAGLKNINRNNHICSSTEEVIWLMGTDDEDDEQGEEIELREVSYEEEVDGEEADTVDNNVNLAFHYQTDTDPHTSTQDRSCHPLPTTAFPEEQLRLLASLGVRRHSMPVPVRQDPGYSYYYYPGGNRQDSSYTCYNFLRRQSLPTTTVQISWPESRRDTLLHKDSVSVDAVKGFAATTKISAHPSTVIDARLHSFSFLPLQTQKQRLQQCTADDKACKPPRTFSGPSHPSSSCLEFRRRSQISREETERVKTALSRVVTGVRTCQQELVGLANSWPSIRRSPEKEGKESDQLKLLAEQLELPSPEESSTGSSLSSSRSNSSDSIQVRFSPPPFLRLLSNRRH